jgi:hypothetical protein
VPATVGALVWQVRAQVENGGGSDAGIQRTAEPDADPRRRGIRDRKLRAVIIHTVETADQRTLAVEEQGDPAGLSVFVHHGAPNALACTAPHEWPLANS